MNCEAPRRFNNQGKPAMPTVTWDHIHLRSPDPEAMAAWLEDILGGEIVRSPGRIDVRLGGAMVFIAPVTAGDGVNAPPLTPYQGLDHFGLTVKDIDTVAYIRFASVYRDFKDVTEFKAELEELLSGKDPKKRR